MLERAVSNRPTRPPPATPRPLLRRRPCRRFPDLARRPARPLTALRPARRVSGQALALGLALKQPPPAVAGQAAQAVVSEGTAAEWAKAKAKAAAGGPLAGESAGSTFGSMQLGWCE